jgi:hypothetical protein
MLSGIVIMLLLVISVPLSISILSSGLSSLLHYQQAMAQKIPTAMPNFLAYHNFTYGINVQYPSNWLYKGSENTSNTNSNNGSSGQVQTIVTFVPQDESIHALVTIGTINLPPIFQSIRIGNMSSFASLVINNIKQSTPGFRLIESNTSSVKTVATAGAGSGSTSSATIPAQEIVYTAAGPVHKTMAVYAIKGDKAFYISYLTETEAIYSSYLPIAQKMIDSFQIVDAKSTTANITTKTAPISSGSTALGNGREKSTTASPTTPLPFSNATSTSGVSHSSSSSSNATIQKETTELNAAREQLLLAWNRTGFHSQFDTYVNSADGYGVYEVHKFNVFRPGEPIILYVEPVGFTHKPISSASNNTKLYLINLTAGIVLSDKQGNILLGRENIPLLNVISHNKNTELFMNLRVTQSSPFPAGDYVVTYTVTDVPSGKNFKIVKDIVVAGGGSSTSNTTARTE